MRALIRRIAVPLIVAAAYCASGPAPVSAQSAAPFEKLLGRWIGEGRLGIKDGKTETVKCRVTYIASGEAQQVRQTIRCAAEGDKVEVQSTVTYTWGAIKGTWRELSREMSGEVEGKVTPNGFKVAIKGSDLNASMDIIVKNGRQIIEIQFINSSLIGLTLVLTKG